MQAGIETGPRPYAGYEKEARRALEAVLFAAGRPLQLEQMHRALQAQFQIELEDLRSELQKLEHEYPVDGERGFELAGSSVGWYLRTNRGCRPVLEALFDIGNETRLSPAAYETLAVIAYLQPVARRDINEIRGVNSDSSLRTLLERDLVRELGRLEQPGQPVVYGTTPRFLRVFGLDALESLPPCESFTLSPKEREGLRRRLGVSAPLDIMDGSE